MFRSCFESSASVVHCDTSYVHGQLWGKNDWQFSNPRIDTESRSHEEALMGNGRENERDRCW